MFILMIGKCGYIIRLNCIIYCGFLITFLYRKSAKTKAINYYISKNISSKKTVIHVSNWKQISQNNKSQPDLT